MNTQHKPGMHKEHMLVEEEREGERGRGVALWGVRACMVVGGCEFFLFFLFFFLCNYSVLCVRLGWVGARALDKEKKREKNKEKKKSEARK